MKEKTVPITRVSASELDRLDALVGILNAKVPKLATKAIDRSTLGRVALEEFLDRYETEPILLAKKLGLLGKNDG